MKNKTYDILKTIALIVIPFVATVGGVTGNELGWDGTTSFVIIVTTIGTALGTALGVSSKAYAARHAEEE